MTTATTLKDHIVNQILNVCENLKRLRAEQISPEEAKNFLKILNDGSNNEPSSRLVIMFISEALLKETANPEHIFRSFRYLKDKRELANTIRTLRSLVAMGGFSAYLKNNSGLIDIAFELSKQGVDKSLIDELLNLKPK